MKQDFDRQWRFHLGDHDVPPSASAAHLKAGVVRGFADPGFDDSGWRTVDLPHDWAIEAVPDPAALEGSGYLPRGVAWYRKAFELPVELGDQRLVLEFEGISRNATVWVNGFCLGSHASGYTPFRCDITDFVPRYLFQETDVPEPDGLPNVVAVRVDAREPEGWWYEGCGIYRHVRLHMLPPVHFALDGVWWTTPFVSRERATLCVHARFGDHCEMPASAEIQGVLLDPDGQEVAKVLVGRPVPWPPESVALKGLSALPGNALKGLSALPLEMTIDNPRLWSPDAPDLYRLVVTLVSEGAVLDRQELTVGFRWFVFEADHGFSLNGVPLKLLGVNAHQDFAGVGVALPDRLHEKRVELIKAMGANAFRCGHNPPAPAFLEACDRLGLLVMDENRKLDTSPSGLDDLRAMIRRDRNHPCVFVWSLFNEEFSVTRPLAAKAIRTLARVARQEDDTRPLTFAGCNFDKGAGTQACCWREVDVVSRNYGWTVYDQEHARHPEFRCLSGEFSALRETRGEYRGKAGEGGVATPLEYPLLDRATGGGPIDAAGNTLAGSMAELVRHWQAIALRPHMAGGFLWTAMDFRGEVHWPRLHSGYGVMDLCGFPKDSYYYFKAWWRPEQPLVHVFPHWTWPGCDGEPMYLRAFSNCETVELFINGDSQGLQVMPPYGMAEWPVSYRPGQVAVIGYRNGKEVARATVRTAGHPVGMELSADRSSLQGDGRDVVCVSLRLVDAQGTVVPHEERQITWTVSGAGRALGFGNGNPCDGTPDGNPVRSTFRGLCMAICQAAKESGALVIRASAADLPAVVLLISV